MGKKLIIGGSGFVGSILLENLKINETINIDKNSSPFFNSITKVVNILSKEFSNLDLTNVDCVVLLAAEHRDDVTPVSLYYDVNVEGTIRVLQMMDKFNIKKLIFTSSVAVYGLNKNFPNEKSKLDPFNHYGKSKFQAEKEIFKWYEKDKKGKKITIIRPTVIFGERNRGNVYNLIKQIYKKRFLMVGSGLNKKSMAYVRNVAAFIQNRMENNDLGTYIFNYVDKPDLSMNELNYLILKEIGRKPSKIRIPFLFGLLVGYLFDTLSYITNRKYSISSVRIKKFCATTSFDGGKMENIFIPPFKLKEGLSKTIQYEFVEDNDSSIVFYSE